MTEYIDLVVPRGSAELVRRVGREAQMPAIRAESEFATRS